MRIVLTALFFLLFSFCSLAQSQTYLGIQAGGTLSTANVFSQFEVIQIDERFTSGYQFGVVVMNFVTPHVGLQGSVNYIQKGWRQKFAEEANQKDFITQFNYLEVPLLFNFRSGKDRLHFFVNGGCFVEYMLDHELIDKPSSDVLITYSEYLKQQRPDENVVDRIYPFKLPYPFETEGGQLVTRYDDVMFFDRDRDKTIGYGLKGGVGAYYDFEFGTFMVELTGSYAVSDVFDPGDFNQGIPSVSKKVNLGLTIGYLIYFGKVREKI